MNNFVTPTEPVDTQAIPSEAQLLERARGVDRC
jgi:3-hydroxy-9,10-secoandrosta-1,3,5(10)-triene-9,17-dione monooxygenase